MTQPDEQYREELQKLTHTPAAFVDLYLSVEQRINDVINGAGVTDTAGEIIRELFTFCDEAGTDVSDLCVSQAKEIVELRARVNSFEHELAKFMNSNSAQQERITELEELARAQQQQIAAHARQTATYQKSVLQRDEIIADKSRLLRSQNEIINGLHELRRRQVGELNSAVITLFELLGMRDITVTDQALNAVAKRTHGAQYALTVTRDNALMQTRFEITNTGK